MASAKRLVPDAETRHMTPVFVWLLHQPASSAWLKRELAARRPDLRFAFSRPGLTTWKGEGPIESSFARAWGESLGRADDVAGLATHLSSLFAGPLKLHVFELDLDRPADERDVSVVGSRARAVEVAIRAMYLDRFDADVMARPGDRVLDVVCAPAELPDEPLFVGTHVHDDTRGPLPGGVPHVTIPPEAPSRAWAKIEEAIRWSQLVPRAGETAVEIGSAPGGASYALLERGLTVHGVDPGAMAPIVASYRGKGGNRFVHHEKPAAEVERRDLPHTFEWLATDVNLAPMVALKYVERFVALAHGGLKGAFLTLKLNDDGVFDALPRLRDRIERLGGRRVRYTQLPSHRSEIVAIVTF